MTDHLRLELERILASTAGATPIVSGFWVGDTANERRVNDDLQAGRLAFQSARRNAQAGLAALERGDMDDAVVCLRMARSYERAALLAAVTPEQVKDLGEGAKRRGRKATGADLTRRLSDALRAQGDAVGKVNLALAFKADPGLEAECAGRADEALLKAVRRYRAEKI
jgi:hypothetical protein